MGVTGRRPMWADTALRTLLWLTLGGWVGSWVFFATVIARTTFQVLPSTELAGRVVGPALGVLHLYGAVAGLALAVLARLLGRSTGLVVLPLLLGGLCLVSHFGVTAGITEASGQTFGPGGNLEAAARFSQLHRLSMAIFGLVALGAMLLVGLHARADALRSS